MFIPSPFRVWPLSDQIQLSPENSYRFELRDHPDLGLRMGLFNISKIILMNFENLIMVPTWVLVHPRPKLAPYILMRTWVYAESLETYICIYIYTHICDVQERS
jgi:hypothetical protein